MNKLLSIVEVDKDSRVYYQAPDCNRTVYKRIHVVEDDGEILVLGSQCYSILYDNEGRAKDYSYFTGTESRKLTAEERNLLLENTRKLIAQFESEKKETENTHDQKVDPYRQNEIVPSTTLHPRNVSCSYCGGAMQTPARSRPAIGYKCEICMIYHRPSPSLRNGITKAMNAKANLMRETSNNIGHVSPSMSHKENISADAYRKSTGK